MKILKIKKGFITNSSGSYEWIPPVDTNSKKGNSNAITIKPTKNQNNNASGKKNGAKPSTIPISKAPSIKTQSSHYEKINNLESKIPKKELDPNVIALGALFVIVIIIIIIWKIVKIIMQKAKLIK